MRRNTLAWERSGLTLVVRHADLIAEPELILSRVRDHFDFRVN